MLSVAVPLAPLDPCPPPRPDPGATARADLLAAAAAGDEQAWRALVARHRGLLLHVTRRHGLSAEEADDVVQETWVRLLQHVDVIRDAERLPGWLATTARRECIARRRRGWRESLTPDGSCPEAAAETADPGDRWEAERRAALLRQAVTRLPDRERALVEVLLEPEPLSYAQISRRLCMPVGSIGPVRARALRRLQALLDSSGLSGDDPSSA